MIKLDTIMSWLQKPHNNILHITDDTDIIIKPVILVALYVVLFGVN